MSTYYVIYACPFEFSDMDELVWHQIVHGHNTEFILDRHLTWIRLNTNLKFHVLRTESMNQGKKRPIIYHEVLFFEDIPDWEELFDKIQSHPVWDFKYRFPFIRNEWHDSCDIGDDYYETPIDARWLSKTINVVGRKINQNFISTYKKISKNKFSKHIMSFLNQNIGLNAFVIN